jgi:serine/threonine protein kinase
MSILHPIIQEEIRILPIDQDRSRKIHSIVSPDIHIYSFESDFNTFPGVPQDGTYGEIIRATFKENGQPIILKKFKAFSKSTPNIPADLIKEIAYLQLLNKYPQTKAVKLFGVALTIQQNDIYLVLESLEKTLGDIQNSNISSEQLRITFYKLIKAFDYIHGIGLVHNDIKPPNIMIDNNDIRIIDFGLASLLSVGPSTELVGDYICTETSKAPDAKDQSPFGYLSSNRKSYASDMYSIGCTIIQLALKITYKITQKDGKIYAVDFKGYIIRNLSSELISETKFGALGFDILLQIMNNNTHLRKCANDALLHPYFAGLSDDIPIDRAIVNGGNIDKIYSEQVHYSKDEFNLHQMEICYLEIQHQTFIDDTIPLKIIVEKERYLRLMNWIFKVYIDTRLIEGGDTFINSLCIINNNFNQITTKYGDSSLHMQCILPVHISSSIYNHSYKTFEMYSETCRPSFDGNEAFQFILNDLLIENNFKIPIYPISIHIQYIFLKLKYVLKEARINSPEILRTLFKHINLHVFFWIMQPEPYHENATIWEIIIFCANRSLSLILNIPLYEINLHPLLNFITLDDNKYNQMNTYFNSTLNNTYILQNRGILVYLNRVFYDILNPIEKKSLFEK